jgi:two-component system cell cycle response regulator
MTARILVVDDQPLNVKLLEAKLTAEYYDVITACDGVDALAKAAEVVPDIILLDVMMPGMDGYEVCEHIKINPALMHIPVVMVTALGDPEDRIRGIDAGADDFLSKPINDVALFARVRSLLRLKLALDELRLRDSTSLQFGDLEATDLTRDSGAGARILVVEDESHDRETIATVLSTENDVTCVTGAEEALTAIAQVFDLIIVSTYLKESDGFRLCSQIRSRDATRHVSILMLIDESDNERLAKGLDLGVNDYLYKPIDSNELIARTRGQIRHYRYQERLRSNYHRSVSMAVTDSLTGLYNRHYLDSYLSASMERSRIDSKSLAVAIVDIDFFKAVNDTHGHPVGDQVLRDLAARLETSVRATDMAARLGGEEFVLVMTETDLNTAQAVTARICRDIEVSPFAGSMIQNGLSITASIGVAVTDNRDETAEDLVKRADDALYEAKRGGRNQVVTAAAVA